MIIQPYKMGSVSARALAGELGCRRTRAEGTSKYPGRRTKPMVINWGSTTNRFPDEYYLNLPDAVRIAGDKLEALEWMRRIGNVNIPEYTTDYDEAQEWLRDGKRIVCRELLRSSGGNGITIAHQDTHRPSELPNVPLYVRYMPKRHEYRVHVFQGMMFDLQMKRQRRQIDGVNFQVRSHENGWVFCRHDIIDPHTQCYNQAIAAVTALGLDFGAVDIGYNERNEEYTVYEVNTAPGLEGTTLELYADKFAQAYRRVCDETA